MATRYMANARWQGERERVEGERQATCGRWITIVWLLERQQQQQPRVGDRREWEESWRVLMGVRESSDVGGGRRTQDEVIEGRWRQ